MSKKPTFELQRFPNSPVNDAELLADLIAIAKQLNANTVSMPQYEDFGKYNVTTIGRRFGSWNKALIKAGLALSNESNISDERLFENLLALWQHYGRQPRRRELSTLPSTISQSPYNRRFGSWVAALEAFVRYANAKEIDGNEVCSGAVGQTRRKRTPRDPNLRQKVQVLMRDKSTCRLCGSTGVKVEIDHIVPWSKGGETILENLQVLCSNCNRGKSNIHNG